MLDPDGLNVWSDQRLVGYLWRNTQGLIGFRYGEEWLAQGEFATSHTLPLQQKGFMPEDGLARRFFANLLPEGGVRDQIVRDLKIANTDFNLLRAIGGECAGALSILQAEHQPSTEHGYHKVPDEELANLVARRGQVSTWTERMNAPASPWPAARISVLSWLTKAPTGYQKKNHPPAIS